MDLSTMTHDELVQLRNNVNVALQHNTDPFRKNHERLLRLIGRDNIRSVEHVKIPYRDGRQGCKHVVCVVMRDGRCGVGQSTLSEYDTYNRQRGYSIALGKALSVIQHWGLDRVRQVWDNNVWDYENKVYPWDTDRSHFEVDMELTPSEFYHEVREQLRKRGYIRVSK